MTITTAKRRRAAAPVALLALLAAPAARAGWEFTPTVTARETWTDNVALAAAPNAQGEFITEAAPGFTLAHTGRRLELHAMGEEHFYAFSGKRSGGTTDTSHQLAADGRATLVDELLFVDGAAARSQQAVSAFGPQVVDNGYATANRAEIKTWRISPYLRHRFGARAIGELRYSRDSVDPGTRDTGFGHSLSSTTSASLVSGPSWQSLGWGLDYTRQQLEDSRAGKSSSENALANARYRLTRTFALTASGGYDKYDYQAMGGRTSGRNWSAGFAWNPSLRTSLEASVGRRYFGASHRLAALHRSRHSVWNISWDEAVTSTRQQFLLPAAVDTAAMLDRLFLPSYPDPEQRRLAVEAYMRATGVPPVLGQSINYLSNRFVLQKALLASVAFSGSRSTLLLSAFNTRRTALSIASSDSELADAALPSLNDNTRQAGVNAQANYKLAPRTGVDLGLTVSRTTSLTTGLVSDNDVLRLGVKHQFGQKLDGGLELRHVRGSFGAVNGASYSENAIVASLSMRL
jgi:uncharacterized protein (PEP-CTERM system associated)